MTRADLDKQPGDVAAMFDGIAERYDLLNDILSAGQVRLWRRAVARITGAGLGNRVLDLAAGTGTSALSFTATGADCVACDFSLGMLRPAERGPRGPERGSRGRRPSDRARLRRVPRRACGGFQGGRPPWETQPGGRRRAPASVP